MDRNKKPYHFFLVAFAFAYESYLKRRVYLSWGGGENHAKFCGGRGNKSRSEREMRCVRGRGRKNINAIDP